LVENSLNDFAEAKLHTLEQQKLKRNLQITARHPAAVLEIASNSLISFACNDYLGLSHHPDVIAASIEATKKFGVGAGASRLISGNHPEYAKLERTLARLKATEDAVVFGSGYLTNLGTVTALAGSRDLILLDEYSHSCLISGAKLSGARLEKFRHNDVDHCAEILQNQRQHHRNALVLTEGVFSMDGDLAPLQELRNLAQRHSAWLLCDDAHGLGVVGNGRGSTFTTPSQTIIDLQMGTLSKAVGVYGGYVCASQIVCDFLRNRARTFIYSTGLPPGTVAAAQAALEIIETQPELTVRPLENAQRFTKAIGADTACSAIVPLILGSAERALTASEHLLDAGYFVPAIRPPTVARGTARLRFAFSAQHNTKDIDKVAQIVSGILNAYE